MFNRTQILPVAAWLAVPMLLTLAMHICVGAYARHGRQQLAQRWAWATLLPNLKTEAASARTEIAAFSLSPDQHANLMEALTAEFDGLAQKVRFKINSLSMKKSVAEAGTSTFSVSLAGAGDIAAMSRFVHAVQTNEYLLSVETAHLQPRKDLAEDQYGVSILFGISALPLTQGQ